MLMAAIYIYRSVQLVTNIPNQKGPLFLSFVQQGASI